MSAETSEFPRFASLGGQAPPVWMVDALRSVESMPEVARAEFWRLLGPSLSDPIPANFDALGAAFAAEFELRGDRLATVVHGCRELIRAAVALASDAAALRRDLEALLGSDAVAVATLVSGYAAATEQLEREHLRRAVEQHGRHAADFSWRIDHIAATDHSLALRSPVLTLTFDCHGQGGRERITMQILPHVAERLLGVLEKVAPTKPK